MTREEAIQALKDLAEINVRYRCDDKWITALDIAIEALQAEYEDYEHATLVDIKEPLKVSVVRCKDCIHQGYGKCPMFDDYLENETHDDDYCSYGEIAEGGDAEVTGTPSYMQQSRHDDGRPQEELLTHEQAWEEIERPHGEWQMCEDDDGIYGNCSVCGCDADFSHYCKAFDFCPNCGADMRTDYTDAFNEQFGDALEKLDKLTLKGGDHDE